jgi:Tol biopolymer transport system component
MTGTLRDLLARGADEVERPVLDVGDLVAQAERRLVRRRLGVVAASVAAVAAVVAGGIALEPDDQRLSPAPPAPSPTGTPDPSPPATQDPKPALSPAIYFDALAVDGDDLTDPALSIGGQKDIYLTREGGPGRQVIATQANEHCPAVAPEGDLLAYLEGRAVVVRPLGPTGNPGSASARVAFDTSEVTCPQWSPDGQRVAVAVSGYESPDQTLEVWVIEVDGTHRVVATRRAQYMPLPDIAWSPDGDAIAYTSPDSVRSARLDGGEPAVLWRARPTQDPPVGTPPPGRPTRLSWWAPGELAVGALARYSDVGTDETVHLLDPDTGRDQVLGNFPLADPATWSWSPDGSRLVFSDSDGGARVFDRASGRSVPLRPRLDGRQLAIWRLAWSADGSRLVGTAYRGGRPGSGFALVSMDPDGSSVETLTPWTMALYSEADVSWSPR